MNNNLGWSHALGIGFQIPRAGHRHRGSGNGPYTELMQKYEIWLRDKKGVSSYTDIDSDRRTELRTEFFLEHIEQHPEWFSTNRIEKMKSLRGKSWSGRRGVEYKCTGCQGILSGEYLGTHKH